MTEVEKGGTHITAAYGGEVDPDKHIVGLPVSQDRGFAVLEAESSFELQDE